MPHELTHAVRIHQEMRERLALAYGLDPQDEAITGTIEGELDTRDRIVRVLREAKVMEAMSEGLLGLLNEMADRKHRLTSRASKLREVAAWAMSEIGETSIKSPDMTISFRMGKSSLIIDEARLDPIWTKTKTIVSPDKAKIQEAVDNGDVPEGVEIRNPQPILTVRNK